MSNPPTWLAIAAALFIGLIALWAVGFSRSDAHQESKPLAKAGVALTTSKYPGLAIARQALSNGAPGLRVGSNPMQFGLVYGRNGRAIDFGGLTALPYIEQHFRCSQTRGCASSLPGLSAGGCLRHEK